MRPLHLAVALSLASLSLCLTAPEADGQYRRPRYQPPGPAYDYTAPVYSYSVPVYRPTAPYAVPYPPNFPLAQLPNLVNAGAYDRYFTPGTMTVLPGTTVRWTNYGSHAHTVTAADGSWDSGDLAPGATYAVTFFFPGTYTFHCRHHKGMRGTVVVSASAGLYPGGTRSSGY